MKPQSRRRWARASRLRMPCVDGETSRVGPITTRFAFFGVVISYSIPSPRIELGGGSDLRAALATSPTSPWCKQNPPRGGFLSFEDRVVNVNPPRGSISIPMWTEGRNHVEDMLKEVLERTKWRFHHR